MHKYKEIRAELIRRINDKTWPTGLVIPHEDNLAKEFGVARGTIRHALSGLIEAGLLERKRRAGTRVAKPVAHASTLRIAMVRHEIEEKGFAYSYKLLQRRRVKSDLKTASPDGVLHLLCLHIADGNPYQLEDRRISLSAIPEGADVDFSDVSPNEWLIQKKAYTSVRTELQAARPSAADIKYLDLARDEPVFVIERETFLDGIWLTHVRLSHPATTFRISTLTHAS